MSHAVALQSSAGGGGVSAPSPSGDTRPQMEKAVLKLYDPTPSAARRGRAGQHPVPVQPQGGDDPEGRQVGAEDGQGRQEGRAAGVQRRGAVQADAGDVLRRLGQAGRQRGRRRREAVQLHRADGGQRRPEETEPASGRPALGCDRQLPRVRHLGQCEVHAVHLRRPAHPGALHAWPWRRCPANPAAEPDLGQRRRASLTAGRRGLARVRRLRRVRRPGGWRPSPASTASTTRSAAGRVPCCCHPPRSSDMSFTSTFLVEIDGTALPGDVAPLLTAAYVDDSQRYPDMFELRFRDPAHWCCARPARRWARQ